MNIKLHIDSHDKFLFTNKIDLFVIFIDFIQFYCNIQMIFRKH